MPVEPERLKLYHRRQCQNVKPPPRSDSAREPDLRQGPNLVVVPSCAVPRLEDVAVVVRSVGEVKAGLSVLDSNTLVTSVKPSLGSQTGVALPDLQLDTVGGS